MAMVTKYIDLNFVVKDKKKGKKKGIRLNSPIKSNNNDSLNKYNSMNDVKFKDNNDNSKNNNINDNDNDKKKNDDNIGNVGVPTPRRSYPPLSLKRIPQHPSTKIKTDTHEKWVIDSKNLDRHMLLLQQDLEISNKRKDEWGKEQKNACLSPRNYSNNNFGTRVRKDPNTSGPILYTNRPIIMENGIHDKKWNKDSELIDKEDRAKPQQKADRGHESFQILQKQIKSSNKIDNNPNDKIQILRNSSLIIRTESAIFD